MVEMWSHGGKKTRFFEGLAKEVFGFDDPSKYVETHRNNGVWLTMPAMPELEKVKRFADLGELYIINMIKSERNGKPSYNIKFKFYDPEKKGLASKKHERHIETEEEKQTMKEIRRELRKLQADRDRKDRQ